MMRFKLAYSFLLLFFIPLTPGLHDKYLNVDSFTEYQVHRCQGRSQDHLRFFESLGQEEHVELWTEPSIVRYT